MLGIQHSARVHLLCSNNHRASPVAGVLSKWQSHERNEEATLSGTSNRADMWAQRDIAGPRAKDDYVDDPNDVGVGYLGMSKLVKLPT